MVRELDDCLASAGGIQRELLLHYYVVRIRCVLGTCTLRVEATWLVVARSGAVLDPGVAIERLFRGMRKGRTPSTTLSTAAVCARTSVQSSRSWMEAESSTFGKLTSRFWLVYKKFLPKMTIKVLVSSQRVRFRPSSRQNKWVRT